MADAIVYKAGQFAQLQVPGTDAWRNYSYAHPADGRTNWSSSSGCCPTV